MREVFDHTNTDFYSFWRPSCFEGLCFAAKAGPFIPTTTEHPPFRLCLASCPHKGLPDMMGMEGPFLGAKTVLQNERFSKSRTFQCFMAQKPSGVGGVPCGDVVHAAQSPLPLVFPSRWVPGGTIRSHSPQRSRSQEALR